MVVLALVLLILVVVFSVAIVVSNPAVYDLSLFRVMVPVTSAGVYFTGVGAALLTVVALLLLRLGIRRSRERRQRLKTAEQAAIGSASGADKDSVPSTDRLADDSDASEPSGPTSNLELDPPAATTPAERKALLDEADELSRDEPKQ
jgi:hypothetical protein